MSDTEPSTAQCSNIAASIAAWLPPADALYSDRIWLLQHDPERYFEEYPRSVMM